MEFLTKILHEKKVPDEWDAIPNKWELVWKIYYDFYALKNPHIESVLYRMNTEGEAATFDAFIELPHCMEVFKLSQMVSQIVSHNSHESHNSMDDFKQSPTTENFIKLLHKYPLDDIYKEVIISAAKRNIKFVKTDYKGVIIKKKYTKSSPIYEVEIKDVKWLNPVYDRTHILLALWKYVNL
jgi:hypothetical protein